MSSDSSRYFGFEGGTSIDFGVHLSPFHIFNKKCGDKYPEHVHLGERWCRLCWHVTLVGVQHRWALTCAAGTPGRPVVPYCNRG